NRELPNDDQLILTVGMRMFYFILLILPFSYAAEALDARNIESVEDLARGLYLLARAMTVAVCIIALGQILSCDEIQELVRLIRAQRSPAQATPQPDLNGRCAAGAAPSKE